MYLGGKLIAEDDSVAGVQYSHTDALGSPVARTNAQGTITEKTRFEAYGAVSQGFTPSWANSIGFTGHVNDANTVLVYMQQRYYDPIAGRFLSVDPVVTDANTGKGFGLYTYVDNNPYTKVDPDGQLANNPDDVCGGSSCHPFGPTLYDGDAGKDVNSGTTTQPQQLDGAPRKSNQDEANRVASEVSKRGEFKGKGEADWLYQLNSDKQLTVTVDASKLTVERTGPWSLDKNGGKRAPAEMVKMDQFIVYGHGTVRQRLDGTYGYYDKLYHYDMHMEFSLKSLERNLLTYFSEPPRGEFSNTPFIIRYEGNINLVNPGEATK